ncbi:TPA: hypothetical protein EYP66_25105 [Candidatus Poribacteria bacterium]|nr:hypothetical protein [Candidatus Poribacteria bacterium]
MKFFKRVLLISIFLGANVAIAQETSRDLGATENSYLALRVCAEIATDHYREKEKDSPLIATSRAFFACRDEQHNFISLLLAEPKMIENRNLFGLTYDEAFQSVVDHQIFSLKVELLKKMENSN